MARTTDGSLDVETSATPTRQFCTHNKRVEPIAQCTPRHSISAIRLIDFAQSAIVHLQWMRTTRHIVCSSHTSEFSINSANAAVWHCKSDWPTGPTDHTHTQSRYHQQDANVLTPNRSQTYANTLIGSLKRYTTLIVHIYKWQQQPRSHLTENHQCSVCSFVSLFFCFFFCWFVDFVCLERRAHARDFCNWMANNVVWWNAS